MTGGIMKNVGRRLREERGRLGWTVDQFVEKSGISDTSVGNYERGDRAPNAALLLVWHDIGIDIGYVLTGVRWTGSIGPAEQALLDRFAKLGTEEQAIVSALLARFIGEEIDLVPAVKAQPTLHSRRETYKAPSGEVE